MKTPFKDSKIGTWLKDNIPSAISVVENFVPAPVKGALDLVKNIISNDPNLTTEQKEEGLKLATEHELSLLQENNAADADDRSNITERWRMDVTSDNWLSKNIRPLSLIYWDILFLVVMILDAKHVVLSAAVTYIIQSMLLLINSAYFGDRMLQKFTLNKNSAKK